MDLHIGVTTSTGCIVEFDRCGLRWHSNNNNQQQQEQQQLYRNNRDKATINNNNNSSKSMSGSGGNSKNCNGTSSKWGQSLLVERAPEEWMEHWDDVLNEVSSNMYNV